MDEILDFVAIDPLNKIVIQQPIYQKAVRKVTGLSNETISKLTTIACKLFIQLTLLYFLSIIQWIVYLIASVLLSIAELIMGIINWFWGVELLCVAYPFYCTMILSGSNQTDYDVWTAVKMTMKTSEPNSEPNFGMWKGYWIWYGSSWIVHWGFAIVNYFSENYWLMIVGKLLDGCFLALCLFIVIGTFPEPVTTKVTNTVTETGYETKKALDRILKKEKEAKEERKSN